MNNTELELLRAKLSTMSNTEFEEWLEGTRTAYNVGYDDGYSDGKADAEENGFKYE